MMVPFTDKINEFQEFKMEAGSSRKRKHFSSERHRGSDEQNSKRSRASSPTSSADSGERIRSVSSDSQSKCSRLKRNASNGNQDLGYYSSAYGSRIHIRHRHDRSRRRNRSYYYDKHSDSTRKARPNYNDDARRWKSSCRPARPRDDEDGHLIYRVGDVLHMRYELGRLLGEGTFGKVIECKDLKNRGKRVAVKIVRKIDRYYSSAKMEVDILQKLDEFDPENRSGCVHMLDWFDFHGHICMVFSMLGDSVFDFQRRNRNQPFTIDDIQIITQQLCQAVKFCHDNQLTHTDLKPENILFVDSAYDYSPTSSGRQPSYRRVKCPDIKVIDFGSATFERDHHTRIISTQHYRAPEVILEEGWSYPSDVWSIGCIVFELYTGRTLFWTDDTIEHLAMMESVLGPIPASMVKKTRKHHYFKHGLVDWDRRGRRWTNIQRSCKHLDAFMESTSEKHRELFDLLRRMLEYRPQRRITLDDALKHPFFTDSSDDDSRRSCHRIY